MVHGHAAAPLPEQMRLLAGVLIITVAAGQAVYPIMPDCTSLQPTPCEILPNITEDGTIDYKTGYFERCSNHACVVPQPSSTTYAWTDPSNPAAVPIAVTPWFCPDFVTLDYPARVVNGTGLPPGKAEDLWAQCNYAGLQYNLLLDDCRDMRLWTCDDCESAYRAWACSVAFRRCNTTDPSGFMVPTCDDVCWATVRQCPATQQFSCPNNGEKGDYVNATGMPECNDPRVVASRSLFPGGAVIASLGDGGYPVVTAAAPAPLAVAPPIIEAPATTPGLESSNNSSSPPAGVSPPPGPVSSASPQPPPGPQFLVPSRSPPPAQSPAPPERTGAFSPTPSTLRQVATVQAVMEQQQALQAVQMGGGPAVQPPPSMPQTGGVLGGSSGGGTTGGN